MRQLVLVEEGVSQVSARKAAQLAMAERAETAIVIVETTDDPMTSEGPAGFTIQAFGGGDGPVIALARHALGAIPETVSDDLRTLLIGADQVVACCPQGAFGQAMSFYHPFLFSLDGWAPPGQVLDSTSYLIGLTDHRRAEAGRMRHQSELAPQGAAPNPPEPAQVREIWNRPPSSGRETTVLETFSQDFGSTAARAGFEFNREKVRQTGGAVAVRRGPSGIVIYGPYLPLATGAYRYRVRIDGGRDTDVGFLLEAVFGAGERVLASEVYEFAGLAGPAEAILEFDVHADEADRPVELRLWNAPASAEYKLLGLALVRISP